jgi:hypothetical protein
MKYMAFIKDLRDQMDFSDRFFGNFHHLNLGVNNGIIMV